MSSAAITLQCPACGGVFLTLQQGTGGAEICPHCSMSAPRGRYRTVEAQSSPGARAVLPPRRPDQTMGTPSQPVPVLTAAMTPEAAVGEHTGFSTNLPPARSGFGEELSGGHTPDAPTPAPTAPPAAGPIPASPAANPTAEVGAPPFYPPATAGFSSQPVLSERVPIPPVPPGELPLPSRVLQTLPTGTSKVPTFQQAPSAPASQAAPSTAPDPVHPVLAPIAPPTAPTPPSYAPTPPASVPLTSAQPTTAPSPIPVAYPPVSVPPPAVHEAAPGKGSPAQLWEAAVLQHQQQVQDTSIVPTGRELYTAGAAPVFQPAPLPAPGPVTFGPLAPPVAGPEIPENVPMPTTSQPVVHDSGAKPHTVGTVLPTGRTMPPAGYGALPMSSSTANPLPPPQIGFVTENAQEPDTQHPSAENAPASPFSIAAAASPVGAPPLPPPPGLNEQETPPIPDLTALERSLSSTVDAFPRQDDQAHAPAPVPAPHEEAGLPQPPPSPTRPPQDLALVTARMARNSGHTPAPAPSRGKGVFWMAGLIFGSLALATGLHFLKERWLPRTQANANSPALAAESAAGTATSPAPVFSAAAQPPSPDTTPATAASPHVAASAPTPEVKDAQLPAKPAALSSASTDAPSSPAVEPAPIPSTPPIPPPPPAAPAEEVRRAMPSNPNTLSISQGDPLPAIAAKLIFGIESANSAQERARWIAEPEKYSAAMEQFIKLHGGRLNTREVEPLPMLGPVRALPAGEEITLFRVNSPASRGGAILRLHVQDGSHLIDWPLFAQTYDNAFDRFLAASRAVPGNMAWHTVLCSLVEGSAVQDASQEGYLMLKVQGSLAETGVTDAWAEKASRVGRYLEHQMKPGHTYLIEMQFSATGQGSRQLMVLDCAGVPDEPTQANANK